MRYVLILWTVFFIVSCSNETTTENISVSKALIPTIEKVDSVLIHKSHVNQVVNFEKFLFIVDSLGFNLESTEIIKETYLSNKSNFSQIEIDSAYYVFLDFLEQIKITGEDDKALYEYDDVKHTKIAKYYLNFGVLIDSDEGEYYTSPNYEYLYNLFKNDVNKRFSIYIKYLVLENEHIYSDGGVMISWMELGKMILEVENYYYELSNTKYQTEILETYSDLSRTLMFGTENTWIVNDEDSLSILLPEAKIAYDYLIHDTIHKTGRLFEKHLLNMQDVNFEIRTVNMHVMNNKEIESYLMAEN